MSVKFDDFYFLNKLNSMYKYKELSESVTIESIQKDNYFLLPLQATLHPTYMLALSFCISATNVLSRRFCCCRSPFCFPHALCGGTISSQFTKEE